MQRIQLIPAGEFRANDGRPVDAPFWRLNPQRAAVLVAELNARPVRLMVDYEHQTLFTAQNGQPNPASGWLSGFEWIDGKELYAEVQWTAAAKQRIAGGEYRYISPVFQYTPAGDILSLLPPALTNTPALDQLDPVALAAASRLLNTLQPSQKDEAMNEAQKLMLSRCLGCLKPPARRSNWPRYSKSKAAPMAKSWPKPWPPPKRQPSRKTNRPSRTS